MKDNFLKTLLISLFIMVSGNVYSQNQVTVKDQDKKLADSLAAKGIFIKPVQQKPQIVLNKDQAVVYIKSVSRHSNWKNQDDPLRKALEQLLFYAVNNKYDSTRYNLINYSYDSLMIPWINFYKWDTLRPVISILPLQHISSKTDSAIKADTILKRVPTDSLRLQKQLRLFNLLARNINLIAIKKDSLVLIATDTLNNVTPGYSKFPFISYRWPYEGDSIQAAVNSLIGYIDDKDSMVVNLSGPSGNQLPVWLNSRSGRIRRFWLKNENNDSVTVWVGSVAKNTIGLFLENGIIFLRPTKESKISDAQLNLKRINNKSLMEITQSEIKPHYWKLHSESSFVFNQTALTNWVRGGEKSLALASDLTGYADYNNKKLNITSDNFIRLKYGLLKSGTDPMRKNMDLLETNSKLNHKAFGKFDFSAVLLFKTQIAKGFNYPNDSVPVSKFLNPAVITFGLGLDYKPDRKTSINFSPLTYKGTFVTDTGKLIGHIDQTKYGIPANKKALHEPGASLLITNEFNPYKTISVTNRLQLFTNYIHNPQNVDVDWEMIATAKINWFTDVRFNTHLIFDDDTKTVVLDKNNKPVLLSDGTQKKTARVQFKELFGFSLSFRF